ncbi:Ribonuclease PH, partial [Dissostichus eleginoides]
MEFGVRDQPPNSAWLLKSVVQTQPACEEKKSHRKPIWTPSEVEIFGRPCDGAVTQNVMPFKQGNQLGWRAEVMMGPRVP